MPTNKCFSAFMLLVYTPKITSRLDFVFKHICTRILGLKVGFTDNVEVFQQEEGPKMVYAKQNLDASVFLEAHGLLHQVGFEDVSINLNNWDEVPCFFACRRHSLIDYDIFSASFYLLSRYEEYLPHVKDEMGRFPAVKSLAHRGGFLDRPVVDIWAMKFGRLLQREFPELVFGDRSITVHHTVQVQSPYLYLHRGIIHNLAGFLNDFYRLQFDRLALRAQVLLKLRKDPYNVFTWLTNASKNDRTQLTVFFFFGQSKKFKNYINNRRKQVLTLVKFVSDYVDTGLLFSAYKNEQLDKMKAEKRRLEALTHRQMGPASIVDQQIDLPHRYRMLVELEVKQEASMYYYDSPGFRAGTCTPFLFYDLDYEIKTPLTIYPTTADAHFLGSMKEGARFELLKALFMEVDRVSGHFVMAFRNTDLVDQKKTKFWRKLLTTDSYEFFR